MSNNSQEELSKPYKFIDNSLLENKTGRIVVYDNFANFPFIPERFFTVMNSGTNVIRGAHAHRSCEQILFAIEGSIELKIDDGKNSHKMKLDFRSKAVYIPRMLWSEQIYLSNNSILGVFASEPYNEEEYIRDYDIFKKMVGRK
jgi:dTDP-4-dehydrorhamnose 3,5-epimerase-like enzyme